MPTWLPNFVNPGTAAIAAAITVPLLLLLYFLKLRRREMAVSSTLLWKKAIQDLQVNAPFQKLRRNLLLLLQMLLLLLLLLAIARPIINYTPGAGKLTVIIIDRSASMAANDLERGKTRLDIAKEKAKEIVDSMDRNSSAAVIAFDESAETLQAFTSDGAKLRNVIDSIRTTDRRSKLQLAYQLAEAQSTFIESQNRAMERPDVYLFSDGRISDAADLRITGNVTFVPIGTQTAGNIGIVALSAKRNYENPVQVQVFARLANFGDKPATAQVQLSVASIDPVDPQRLQFEARAGGFATVDIPPTRWSDPKWVEANPGKKPAEPYPTRDSVEFNIDVTTAAVIRVEQKQQEGDLLLADDVAQVVVPPPKQLAVLHVTDGQNPFMDMVLASLNLKNLKKVTPAEYAAAIPSDYDVILFDRYSPAQLPPAGSFIYFGAYPPPDVKLQPVRDASNVVVMAENVRVVDWKRDHPILRGLNLSRVGAEAAIKFSPSAGSQVLVDGVSGPLIILHREGRGTHMVIAFDVLRSNWPVGMKSWPYFMYNTVKFMAIGSEMDVRESLQPGATPRIPRANIARLGDEKLKEIKLIGPGGTRTVPIPPTGDFALPPLDRVGVYQLDPPIPQFERIAVNLLDENESNLLPVEQPPGNIGTAVVTGQNQSRLELWWWIIAAAALPLLLIEWWVYTRRVHL